MSNSVEQVSPAAPAPAPVVVDTSASDLDVAATADYAEQMLNCQMRIDSLARDFDLAEAESESASEGCSGMYTFHFHNGASSSSARSVLGRRILEEIECMNQITMVAEEAGVLGEEDKAIKNIQKALTARILKGDGDAAVAKTAAIKNIQKALTARILKGDAAVAKTAAIKNIQKALTARILKGDGDAAVAKTAAIKNIQKALTARILKGDGDAAVAKTAAIKNIQKALTARILKGGFVSENAPWLAQATFVDDITGYNHSYDRTVPDRFLGYDQHMSEAVDNRFLRTLASSYDLEVKINTKETHAPSGKMVVMKEDMKKAAMEVAVTQLGLNSRQASTIVQNVFPALWAFFTDHESDDSSIPADRSESFMQYFVQNAQNELSMGKGLSDLSLSFTSANVSRGALKNLVTDKPSPITVKL